MRHADGSGLRSLAAAVELTRDPQDFFDRRAAAHGADFAASVWPLGDITVISRPSAIADLFAADPDRLCAGAATRRVLPLLAGSILCADGEAHERRHPDLLPVFRASSTAARIEHAEALAAKMFHRLPHDRPVPLLPVLRRLTFAQLAEVVLGTSDERYIAELQQRVGCYLSGVPLLATWSPRLRPLLGVALARRQRSLDEHLRLAVARSQRRVGGEDALSVLLAAGADEQALLAELRALLIVGHETTAAALAWGLDLLARHPDVCARLRDGDEGYADAVVAEVLRLRPPVVDTVRLAIREVELGGKAVPPGTFVLAAPLLTHRDPASYLEPWRFRPERFLDSRPLRGAYLPFGGGSRRCLGAPFASLQLRVVLELAARTLSLRPAGPPERARLRGTAVVPARGAKLIVGAPDGADPRPCCLRTF